MKSRSYADAVGAFVRETRTAHSITMDELAAKAREFGVAWERANIRNIENGSASLTLPVLLTVALSLGELTGKPYTLDDLLGGGDAFDQPMPDGQHAASRDWVRAALSGGSVTRVVGHDDVFGVEDPGAPARWAGATQSEKRIAEKLGIHPGELQLRALYLWNQSLDEEAAGRAGDEASPQKRGRVVRTLADELQRDVESIVRIFDGQSVAEMRREVDQETQRESAGWDGAF